jgi:hypothetical protein
MTRSGHGAAGSITDRNAVTTNGSRWLIESFLPSNFRGESWASQFDGPNRSVRCEFEHQFNVELSCIARCVKAFRPPRASCGFDTGSNRISFRSMVRSHRVLNFELSSFHGAPFHTFAWDDRTKQTRLRRDSATKGLPLQTTPP